MRGKKAETNEGTILPFEKNSCMACWNKTTTSEIGPFAPRSHGIYASFPVMLVEKSGKATLVCYVMRCMNCGHTANFGAVPAIFKNIGAPDTNIAQWPEILRNDIDPLKFETAVLDTKLPVWINAKDVQKQTETRERAPFYEPSYEGWPI